MSAVSSAGKKKTVAITQGAGMARNNWMSRFMVTAFAGVRQDFGADSRQPTADSSITRTSFVGLRVFDGLREALWLFSGG